MRILSAYSCTSRTSWRHIPVITNLTDGMFWKIVYRSVGTFFNTGNGIYWLYLYVYFYVLFFLSANKILIRNIAPIIKIRDGFKFCWFVTIWKFVLNSLTVFPNSWEKQMKTTTTTTTTKKKKKKNNYNNVYGIFLTKWKYHFRLNSKNSNRRHLIFSLNANFNVFYKLFST
jgi:hypothetical protein